jgi:oligopeptide/dipeptide ABC transporter ATP-binding protein
MTAPLLQVEGLGVLYRSGARRVQALADLGFSLARGEMLALVGESGSGKSTAARAIAGLAPLTTGRILIDGHDPAMAGKAEAKALRRRIQMVFQDPDASLNPAHSARAAIAEALIVRGVGSRPEIAAQTEALAARVRLDPALLTRKPRALSGGEKQRVAIARALAMAPDLLIADESLSALDVSTQAEIADLFAALRRESGLAILFISHDLGMVAHLADRVLVLYAGRVVEAGPARAVLAAPRHPYARLLADAVPDLDRGGLDLPAVALEEAGPGGAEAGCAFASRCPRRQSICAQVPPLIDGLDARAVACFFPLEDA